MPRVLSSIFKEATLIMRYHWYSSGDQPFTDTNGDSAGRRYAILGTLVGVVDSTLFVTLPRYSLTWPEAAFLAELRK